MKSRKSSLRLPWLSALLIWYRFLHRLISLRVWLETIIGVADWKAQRFLDSLPSEKGEE